MKVTLSVLASLALVFAEPPAYSSLSKNYGAPSINQLSSLYGAPNFQSQAGAVIKLNEQYGATRPTLQYGAPGGAYPGAGYQGNGGYVGAGGHYGEDYNSEPANYSFEYHVQDGYGNDFGHQEARQGDVAQGRYFVLLPDGRRQIVDYIADQSGYNPKVSYEGTAYAGAGVRYNIAGYPSAGGYPGRYQNGGYHNAGSLKSTGSHQAGYQY